MLASAVFTAGLLAMSIAPVLAQAPKPPRIGLLGPADATRSWLIEGFREGIAELGYIEGKNIRLESRAAQGQFDRLPNLAAELVDLDVDVIVTGVTAASLAAVAKTGKIPIVMVGVADPVGVGLVASLAHPGGNVTGTSGMAAEIIGKQLELLKDVASSPSRVAVLWNPANSAFQALQVKEAEVAGRRLGVQLRFYEASNPNAFDAAFAAIRREDIRALHILADPLFTLHWEALAELVAKDGLLAISGSREFAENGGLMAYGPSYFHASKRAATYVDKILKGAKSGDLPVEQATQFDLVINLKTAKALGLAVPPVLLARADEVIE